MTTEPTPDDIMTFAEDDGARPSATHDSEPWLVLVVDDEPEVHRATEFQVYGFHFKDRPIQLLNAYSTAAAKEALAKHPGIAVVLLDVVMETEDAGLRLVRYIRDELGLAALRIILRTGQPGAAPEADVVTAYDINDYKAKTELTFERLMTSLTSALRNYDGIIAIE
jgi:CheY-like chemotaxis protein